MTTTAQEAPPPIPHRPPLLKYRDGPLAGVVRPKSPVNGRMPRFRDRFGEPVPTAQIERYRQPCNCVAFALYMQIRGCVREGWVYRWIDIHDEDHGKDPCEEKATSVAEYQLGHDYAALRAHEREYGVTR